MYVYYTFVVVPVVRVETRIVCMYLRVYVCVCYTVVLMPGDPLRICSGNFKNVCVCVCVCTL